MPGGETLAFIGLYLRHISADAIWLTLGAGGNIWRFDLEALAPQLQVAHPEPEASPITLGCWKSRGFTPFPGSYDSMCSITSQKQTRLLLVAGRLTCCCLPEGFIALVLCSESDTSPVTRTQRKLVVDRTRTSFEIANTHAETMGYGRPESTPEVAKPMRKPAHDVRLIGLSSFLMVAGFGCISISMFTTPGGLAKLSFPTLQFCMGLTAVTIFEGCVLVTKAVAIYKDVKGPVPPLSDRKSLIFEVTSIALRSIAVIAAAILTCKNTRGQDTPQRVQRLFTPGGPGDAFSAVSRANITPHLTKVYIPIRTGQPIIEA
ncbi:hypothetical protein DFP73DRAFT_596166 [Morchella snyderi]|nr:hypothetical protein DFP73DRAFT_596166 [Morchella snyderi]